MRAIKYVWLVIVTLTPAFASGADSDGRYFPAVGAPEERKVDVAWNRFHDCEGLHDILSSLNEAFGELTQLYSIGKSTQGRDIWCLEVTARKVGNPARKPGMYIDGNIHGNEVQGAETVAYTAWYLCHQYGRVDKVTDLLDKRVFYLIPTINPDSRDFWLAHSNTRNSSRGGMEPTDNDRDGLFDEDGYDDLNGDGSITLMRIKDPQGRYKPDPEYPDYLMVRVEPDEQGQYSILGYEGIDNDGDGRINEDPEGGYDMNRNWAYDWQPAYVQYGAKDYPFSQPETWAVSRFILRHTNIAAAQSYHNTGGMILRSPGRDGGSKPPQDEMVMKFISDRGTKILPFYRSLVVYDDLYTVWGGEIDWLYGGRGILTFTNELWTMKNLYKKSTRTSDSEEIFFLENVLMGEGLIAWQPYEHPTYGSIEIGGTKKQWGRVPPSFMLEEELHRNMAFSLFHADMMPLIEMHEPQIVKLGGDLYRVRVEIENRRLIPTRTAQDVKNHISRSDIVTLRGPNLKVITSGIVLDPYFNKATAVKRRPRRVEIDTIPGMQAVSVQFVVSGSGRFTIKLDSTKGGVHQISSRLP